MASSPERRSLLSSAKLAQESLRYDEMADAMKKLVMLNVELSPDERCAFSKAYKKAIEPRRSSWEILQQEKTDQEIIGAKQKAIRTRQCQETIERELSTICEEAINVLDEHLIPFTANDENLVFYLKMKGDHYRYMAEYKTGSQKEEAIKKSLKAYKSAVEKSEGLSAMNPVVLGSNLNYSVFLYDIVEARRRAVAVAVARRTVDAAVAEMMEGERKGEEEEDAQRVLEVIKGNLGQWEPALALAAPHPCFARRLSL